MKAEIVVEALAKTGKAVLSSRYVQKSRPGKITELHRESPLVS
jgi:hypothetical protein